MKQKLSIEEQIPLAITAAHNAYYGQLYPIKREGNRDLISTFPPPEEVLSFNPCWLANNPGSDRSQRMKIFFAAQQIRRRAVHSLAVPALAHFGKAKKSGRSLRRALGDEMICDVRDCLLHPPAAESDGTICPPVDDLVRAVQLWKRWDAYEIDGWVHENVERGVDELEIVWRPAVAIAIRLKAEGAVSGDTICRLCHACFGNGLEVDRETQTISAFYYALASGGQPLLTCMTTSVRYAAAIECGEQANESLHLRGVSEISEVATRIDSLDTGVDPGAAAARLLVNAFNGAYCITQGKLCQVSLPVTLDGGNWDDISQPEALHPLPEDYAVCARVTLQFLLSGFVWAAMGQGNAKEEERNFETLVDKHWIPLIFKLFYVLASPTLDAPDLALKNVAVIYARLVAIRAWHNPRDMRDNLRGIFRETYQLLARFRKEVADLEEAIKHGLLLGAEDILLICGSARDGRFDEDQRFGILMTYQRERAQQYFSHDQWLKQRQAGAQAN